jgi:diguanylate cyclase (GGDEF)-like protein
MFRRALTAPDPPPRVESAVPVAPVMWLFLTAGVLGLVSLVLPHDPKTVAPGILAVSCTALAVGAAVAPLRSRIDARALSWLLVLGSLLTSAAIHFTDGVPNASATLYTWIALYGAYALPPRATAAHLAFIAIVYAILIALNPPPFPPVAHWTTTIGTLAGAAVLVGALRSRLNQVVWALEAAARTDALTGLLNRRGFQERLESELRRSRRTGRRLAVVMLDLDRFKAVNDVLGHQAGDAVLEALGTLLREETRGMDVTSRMGGEEFAILLPETGAEEAVRLCERLRRRVTRHVSPSGFDLTASFGIALYPEHGREMDELMREADLSLYAAKRGGRDRVLVASRSAVSTAA